MRNLTLEDLSAQIEEVKRELADAIGLKGDVPIAISAAKVAKLLDVNRKTIYEMHHAGELHGFRLTPNAHLRFLVSEVREVARKKSEKREGD